MALIQWAEGKAKRYPEVGMLMAYPIEGKRSIRTAVRLKKKGARKGIPDLFLPVPRWDSPHECTHGCWIEMKTKDGKMSDEQIWWKNNLEAQGYEHYICYSWVEEALAICHYLGIPHDELDHAA